MEKEVECSRILLQQRLCASWGHHKSRTYLPVRFIVKVVLLEVDRPLATLIELGIVLGAHSDFELCHARGV